LANADQLYGFCVESGLKQLMLAFGMSFDTNHDWPAKREDRVHADGIWSRYETNRSGHPTGTKYTLLTANPFADWSASDRYAASVSITQTRVQGHQTGAKQVRRLIKQAQKDGLL
jgi:hypothetical protein